MPTRYYGVETMVPIEEMEQSARVEANAYIHQVVATLTDRGIKASPVSEENTSAANAILDYAELNGVGLIAMSTHGRSGIGRWLMGSIADKVVHGAEVPVLLVRPDESNP